MKILVLGAAGFIGTNLCRYLCAEKDNYVIAYDCSMPALERLKSTISSDNIKYVDGHFEMNDDYVTLTRDVDIVYHLISTVVPGTCNHGIAEEFMSNTVVTVKLLDACVINKVKKIVFLSSGGTVYGKIAEIPVKEDTPLNPISSYGIQKLTIEKLLYLYHYMNKLDYRIIRLANPYGRYQNPNGVQGVVTTFVYKAINNEPVRVFGDGSVVRDYIYIEDAVKAIASIADYEGEQKIFNVGTGIGYSVKEIITAIENTLQLKMDIDYQPGRAVDVPVNILDISRFTNEIGALQYISLEEGILKTKDYLETLR